MHAQASILHGPGAVTYYRGFGWNNDYAQPPADSYSYLFHVPFVIEMDAQLAKTDIETLVAGAIVSAISIDVNVAAVIMADVKLHKELSHLIMSL